MKDRVITGLIIAAVMIPCAVFMHTLAFPVMIAVISAFCVFEMQKATGSQNPVIMTLSCVTAAAIPFLVHYRVQFAFMPVAVIYILVYLCIMVLMHDKTTFNDAVTALFSTLCIPTGISMMLKLRDVYLDFGDSFSKSSGVFFIIFGYIAAWGCDIGANIFGRKFGKHKLAPGISPKKTVEGAVCGVLFAVVLNIVLWLLFNKFWFTNHDFSLIADIAVTVILAIISMFGDLAASIIKRNHGIKDFGKLLPGHGGMMDRFDSILFVIPAEYAAVRILMIGFKVTGI